MNRLSTDLINYITTFLKWNDYCDFFLSINKKINLPLYLKLSKTTLTIDDVCNNEREYLQVMKYVLNENSVISNDNIATLCKKNHINIIRLLNNVGKLDLNMMKETIMEGSHEIMSLYRELEYNSFIKKDAEKGNYIQISGCSFVYNRNEQKYNIIVDNILSEDIDTEYNQMLEYKNKDIYEELKKRKNDVIDIPYDEEKFLEFLHHPPDL